MRGECEAFDQIVVENAAPIVPVQVHFRNISRGDEGEADATLARLYRYASFVSVAIGGDRNVLSNFEEFDPLAVDSQFYLFVFAIAAVQGANRRADRFP